MDRDAITLPGELWKPDVLSGASGVWISSLGRVWRDGFHYIAMEARGSVLRWRKPCLRRTEAKIKGYSVVRLDGRNHYINRLVCAAFHGSPPFPDAEAAHRNGIRSQNESSNLRWATSKENHADRRIHGTDPRGERHPRAKLTDDDVLAIRRETLGRQRVSILTERFKVSRSTIYRILDRSIWAHI